MEWMNGVGGVNGMTGPGELPMGLGLALLQDPRSTETFQRLPYEMQQEVLEKAKGVSTREEMQALVERVAGKYGMSD